MFSAVAGGNSAIFSSNTSIIQSPKGAKTTNSNNKTFQKHTGRKIIDAGQNNVSIASSIVGASNAVKTNGNSNLNMGSNHNPPASIEDLELILELDSMALTNMKSDITKAQHEELIKIQNNLLNLQKEFDTILISNNIKQKELQSYEDKLLSLQDVDSSVQNEAEILEENIKLLNIQNEEAIIELLEEQRSIKMQRHMIKRLNEEITLTKIETNKAVTVSEQTKHDLEIVANSILMSKQELIEEELVLEKLLNTMKARKEQRDGKINVLHHISIEAENSIIKLQTSLLDNSVTAQVVFLILVFLYLKLVV